MTTPYASLIQPSNIPHIPKTTAGQIRAILERAEESVTPVNPVTNTIQTFEEGNQIYHDGSRNKKYTTVFHYEDGTSKTYGPDFFNGRRRG